MLTRVAFAILAVTAGCLGPDDDEPGSAEETNDEAMVTIDTRARLAREQYDAEVAFANGYVPRCTAGSSGRPRVLVSGFGRFRDIANNATGRIVAKLGDFAYPETQPPRAGEIDPPGPQVAAGTRVIDLPDVGEVDVCAIVLPVVWDLAPILLVKELAAFEPDLVIMNGVADPAQPLWIELGAINKAVDLEDGSGILEPSAASIIKGAAMKRANLMSWNAIRGAARRAIADDPRLGDILTGVKEQAPRATNSYLCNNLTYVTGYLMDAAPGTEVPLLVASEPIAGRPNKVVLSLARRFKTTPRVFLHWPARLTSAAGIAGGAELLRTIIAAQLVTETAPTRGSY